MNVRIPLGLAILVGVVMVLSPLAGALPSGGPAAVSTHATVAATTPKVVSIPVGSRPSFAAYDSGNGYVYVTNTGSNNVSIISGTTNVGSVGVGSEPGAPLYDPGNGYVYVPNPGTNSSLNGSVSILSGNALVATVPVGPSPQWAAYDSGNGYVYVPNSGFNSTIVSVFDGTTVVASIDTRLYNPSAAAYDPGNGYIYVVFAGPEDVAVINGTSVVGTLPINGTPPEVPVYDGATGYIYVPVTAGNLASINRLYVINGTKLVGSVPLGSDPSGATYDPGNGYVYVSNGGSANVSVIKGTTLVGTLPVGASPAPGAYDSENGFVYVPNGGSNNVSVINGTAVVGTIASKGAGSMSALFVNATGTVYVPSAGSNTVSAILTLVQVSTTGYLSGTVSPASATVLANGVIVPVADGTFNVSEAPGPYYLSVSAPGYEPITTEANVSAGMTTRVDLVLSVTSTTVTLSGSVTPANASVMLNGFVAYVDPTGDFQVSVVPGTYAVSVSASGYFPYSENLTISSNTTANFVLAKEPTSTSTTTSGNVTATGYGVTVTDLARGNGSISVTFTATGSGGTLLVSVPYASVANVTLAQLLSSRIYVNNVPYTNFSVTVTTNYTVTLTVRGLAGDPTLFWALSPTTPAPKSSSTGTGTSSIPWSDVYLGIALAVVVAVVLVTLFVLRPRRPPAVAVLPKPEEARGI